MTRSCTLALVAAVALFSVPTKADDESGGGGIAHNVYFTLREASEESAAKIVAAMEKHLAGHPGEVYFAAADRWQEGQRPVHDQDWDIALHAVFKDVKSLEAYEVSERHKAFVDKYKPQFSKVRVFDSVIAKSSHAEEEAPGADVFVWHELMTRDAKKAREFYKQLFGWDSEEENVEPVGKYVLFKKDGKEVGGLLPMEGPDFEGVPANWLSYMSTDDIEATVKKAKQLGAQVRVPIVDLKFGKFAVLADPTGAVFAVFEMAEQ